MPTQLTVADISQGISVYHKSNNAIKLVVSNTNDELAILEQTSTVEFIKCHLISSNYEEKEFLIRLFELTLSV